MQLSKLSSRTLGAALLTVALFAATFFAPTVALADFDPSPVRVNQIGYLLGSPKIAVVVNASATPVAFEVRDASTQAVVLSGQTTVYGNDWASGDHVHHADMTALAALGSYKLVVGADESVVFDVAPNLYTNLPHEAMNYFYFHRLGVDALKAHLIDDRFDRGALHPGDASIPPYSGWCGTCSNFDLLGSWADAGDFGIYSVNHAVSAWTLMNLIEMFPAAFADGELNLPESGNGVNDMLDEADYGSRFLRGMLPTDGGLASHKAHNHAWGAFSIAVNSENAEARSAMASSTNATYAVARNTAQLARLWEAHDTVYASQLWAAAEDAWSRADGTAKAYDPGEASPGAGDGGGDYGDSNFADDRYAAAVELYLTAYSRGDAAAATYKSALQASGYYKQMAQWDWASVDGAATLSLHAVANDLSANDQADIEASIVAFADGVVAVIDSEGYPVNIDGNPMSGVAVYPWGSNSFIMNRAIALAYAYEITGDSTYQGYILRTMDYLLGVNAMRLSYITGYGEYSEGDTHDRWAWTVSGGSFWPAGWLSGGPNDELINDTATPTNAPPAKSYGAPGTGPDAWASKENTVNWNAPLAWVAWYVENKVVPVLGGCVGNCAPQAFDESLSVEMDTPTAITLAAHDVDGTVASWSIVQQPANGSLSGTAPNLTYTPDSLSLGGDTFTFTATDDDGATSNVATVSILTRQCDYLDIFDVPRFDAFPDTSSITYNYVHVSENGPNLSNVTTHVTKTAGVDINQFSLATSDGNPDSYNDLQTCMPSETFGQPNPGFTLAACGFSNLDGDYWINKVGTDEVWIEKSNGWAIYYSNDPATPEFCRTTPECTASVECDDGLFCNGAESCANNGCQLGTDPCPGANCDEVTDQCVSCVADGGGQPCTASTDCCSGVGNCTGGKPSSRTCL
jgi:endoglucanase